MFSGKQGSALIILVSVAVYVATPLFLCCASSYAGHMHFILIQNFILSLWFDISSKRLMNDFYYTSVKYILLNFEQYYYKKNLKVVLASYNDLDNSIQSIFEADTGINVENEMILPLGNLQSDFIL